MKLLPIVIGVLISACVIVYNLQKTSHEEQLGRSELVANSDEAIAKPRDLVSKPNRFYVNFELLVFPLEIEKYPKSYEAFQRALVEWAKYIPVRWVTHKDSRHPMFTMQNKPGIIKVRFVDMNDPKFGGVEDYIGMWQSRQNRILIDGEVLESLPQKAYNVALHELGHMLGVPHIISFDDLDGYTGFLVMPKDVDAESFIMYPKAIKGKEMRDLTSIEIELARHNLIHHWTRPDRGVDSADCKMILVDNGV